MSELLLELKNITKIYNNGTKANDNIQFELQSGEIHAIAGENGAGKSTLMKILYGLEQPDSGEIYLSGKLVHITSPSKAIELNIGMVHQHFMLIESLTVVENMMLGVEPTKGVYLDYEKAIASTMELAEHYQLHIDPSARVNTLSVGLKQRLEILKVLSKNAKIIILDEPTAVLTPQETKELFHQLILLKQKGYSIIMITHKLSEIKELCDRITILRSGKYMGTYDVKSISESEITHKMIGRQITSVQGINQDKSQEVILELRNVILSKQTGINMKELNLTIHSKEIVGIAGVEGNGQQKIVEMLTGYDMNYLGDIYLCGENIKNKSIKELRTRSFGYIPEDRMGKGINPLGSIVDNIISTSIDHQTFLTKGKLLLKKQAIEQATNELSNTYQVKTGSIHTSISLLSGGNIQKVVCARELHQSPKFLIADQPSRGVDVGAIEFIHSKIRELRDSGSGILLISADLNELFQLSNRIIVLYKGQIVGNFENNGSIDEYIIGEYMLGLKKQGDMI